MRKVERYITSDNIEHVTKEKALKHAEKRVSDKVFYLADKLYPETRTNIVQYIMYNLQEFEKLIELQKDTILEEE